jgi:hypothetical protein
MGTFTKKWTEQLEDGRKMNEYEIRWMKKVLRVIVSGARGVMREYTRLNEVSEGDARELRQTSIVQFTKEVPGTEPKKKKAKKIERGEPGWAPNLSIWAGEGGQGPTKLAWSSGFNVPDLGVLGGSQLSADKGGIGRNESLASRLGAALRRANTPRPWTAWRGTRAKIAVHNLRIAPCLGETVA